MISKHADRRTQIAWFNRLRLFAVLGVTGVAVLAHELGVLPNARPVLLLAGVTLLVDIVWMALFVRLRKADEATLRRFIDVQIGVDLVLLTALLHESGGATNPFVLFYLFHTFIASLLRSSRAAVVVAVVSSLSFAALAFGEWHGWIQHHPIEAGFMDLREASGSAVGGLVGVFTATQLISVYFLSEIMRQLTRREEELGGLQRQLGRSEKLAAIGTLAAGVAHEINNPISVIQNRVQILRYRIADGDAQDDLQRELDVIDKHTQRVGKITQGLLTFAKETPFALSPTPVNALVREAADLVRVPFRDAAIELRLELDPSAPSVPGSANHLLQVLINLLLNARDASPSGSTVRLATEAEGDHVRLVVADQGCGIPRDNLAKIFDPFFTTKDVDKGTGLGLAISHGIVERHSGRIEVSSAPGEGATFVVWLPRSD